MKPQSTSAVIYKMSSMFESIENFKFFYMKILDFFKQKCTLHFMSISPGIHASSSNPQYTEERLGQADKTELDPSAEELLAKIDRIQAGTERIVKNAECVLQPNPGERQIETGSLTFITSHLNYFYERTIHRFVFLQMIADTLNVKIHDARVGLTCLFVTNGALHQ